MLVVVYTLEMLLKIFAFKLDYFKDWWNALDFFVVALGISGYVI